MPASGRSSPAATISKVDLPEPDGPTRPTASPLPICRSMSLRIWTRAAPRPSDRLTPVSRIAGGATIEVSFMQDVLRPLRRPRRSYGKPGGAVQRLRRAASALGFLATLMSPAAAADPPIRVVVLGDSLSAGFGLAAQDALPAKLERALKAKGHNIAIENAGVSGDTAAGGPGRRRRPGPEGGEAAVLPHRRHHPRAR